MSTRRGGPGLRVLFMLAALLLARGLSGGGVADAQDGPMKRIPQPPASAGSMGIAPAGGMTGGGGGARAGSAAPGGTDCSAFMQCSDPGQGTGAMVSFEISLARAVASLKIDQLKISMAIDGKPVSWSPRTFPEPGTPLLFPITTPFLQTCADEYGEAISTVEGFAGGKLVARAAGMVHTENCAAVIPTVVLQPVAQTSGSAGATGATAGSTGAGAGSPGAGSPDTGSPGSGSSGPGASAAGQSGSAGSPSADDSSSEDDGSCSCSTLGAARPRSGLAHAGLVLGLAAAVTRAGRNRRR